MQLTPLTSTQIVSVLYNPEKKPGACLHASPPLLPLGKFPSSVESTILNILNLPVPFQSHNLCHLYLWDYFSACTELQNFVHWNFGLNVKRLEQKKPSEFSTRIKHEEINFCIIDSSSSKLHSAVSVNQSHIEHGIWVFFYFGEGRLKLLYRQAILHIFTWHDKIRNIKNLKQIK